MCNRPADVKMSTSHNWENLEEEMILHGTNHNVDAQYLYYIFWTCEVMKLDAVK